MAATPTRAVYLIAIGEVPSKESFDQEQVGAYQAVQQVAAVAAIPTETLQRRNAALEAAGRLYAAANFR